MEIDEYMENLIEELKHKDPLLLAMIYLGHPEAHYKLDKTLGKRRQDLNLYDLMMRVKELPSDRVFITPQMRDQEIFKEGPNAFLLRSVVEWGVQEYLRQCWGLND